METVNNLTTGIKTRGDFQELRKRGSQERRPIEESIRSDHPVWDVWGSIKSAWPGPTVNWDAEPSAMWAHVLNDLNLDQVANGVRNLHHFEGRDGSKSFPPSAGEFHDLCLNNFNYERIAHKMAFPNGLPLEDQKAKEKRISVGLTEIEKIKAMMAK